MAKSVSYLEWVEGLRVRHGVGDGIGLVTPSEARRYWGLYCSGESISVKERVALDREFDLNVRRATAAQALIRGRKSRAAKKATKTKPTFRVLAPFNPTPEKVIAAALEYLQLKDSDILYDIGCGDGRFIISAAQVAPRTAVFGVEADAALATRAEQAALSLPNVTIIQADATALELTTVTKLFLYLVPTGLAAMKATLDRLRCTADIVSYTFAVPEWIPDDTHHSAPDRPALYYYRRLSCRLSPA